jgi:hypothetical protein
MFNLTNDTLKQLRTVYKVAAKFEVSFAASFFVITLDERLLIYIETIRTNGEH